MNYSISIKNHQYWKATRNEVKFLDIKAVIKLQKGFGLNPGRSGGFDHNDQEERTDSFIGLIVG